MNSELESEATQMINHGALFADDDDISGINSKKRKSCNRDAQKSSDGRVNDGSDEVVTSSRESNDDSDTVMWTEEFHRAFVEGIYKIGIRQASPAIILELMENEGNLPLTSERVKSRLQKYRNNSKRSQAEFMHEYDLWITKALTVGRAGGASANYAEPGTLLEMMGVEILLGADVAAFLSYACMAQDAKKSAVPPASSSGHRFTTTENSDGKFESHAEDGDPGDASGEALTPLHLWKGSQKYASHFTGSEIKLPVLTEGERNSPLGTSMSHVVSLFYSMTQLLMKLRSEARGEKSHAQEKRSHTQGYQHEHEHQQDLGSDADSDYDQKPEHWSQDQSGIDMHEFEEESTNPLANREPPSIYDMAAPVDSWNKNSMPPSGFREQRHEPISREATAFPSQIYPSRVSHHFTLEGESFYASAAGTVDIGRSGGSLGTQGALTGLRSTFKEQRNNAQTRPETNSNRKRTYSKST